MKPKMPKTLGPVAVKRAVHILFFNDTHLLILESPLLQTLRNKPHTGDGYKVDDRKKDLQVERWESDAVNRGMFVVFIKFVSVQCDIR